MFNLALARHFWAKDRMGRARIESPFSPSAPRAQAVEKRTAILGVQNFVASFKRRVWSG
jgi:hypothetical protein